MGKQWKTQALKRKAQEQRELELAYDKCYRCKQEYKTAKLVKQVVIRTREAKSINQPKSRFTIATAKEKRNGYKLNKDKWALEEKPKEWVRLKNITVHKARALGHKI